MICARRRVRPGPAGGSAAASPARAARRPAAAPRARAPATTSSPDSRAASCPLKQRIPKLKGFKNPFRVEYVVVNLDTLEAFDGDRGHPRHPARRRPGPQARPGQGARPGRADPAHDRVRPRLLGVGQAGHRGGRRHACRSCRRRSATAGLPPRATRSPTGERAPTTVFSRCSTAETSPRRVGSGGASPGADS